MVISELEQQFLVYPYFDKEAIDKIDRSSRRTAGESLEMMGIKDGKLKAAMAKVYLEYAHELDAGAKPRLTDPDIEKFVMDTPDVVDSACEVGRNSVSNVTDPCLSQTEASKLALVMLMGGYPAQQAVGFIASIQQGIATYPESPTVDLARQFMRAKLSEHRKDRLSTRMKLAYALKGAALWTENQSVARIKWNPAKEKLPSNQPPVARDQAA